MCITLPLGQESYLIESNVILRFACTPWNKLTWHIVGSLVPLLGECDPGAWLPTSLHCDGQDLVSDAGCVPVLVHYLKESNYLGCIFCEPFSILFLPMILFQDPSDTFFTWLNYTLKNMLMLRSIDSQSACLNFHACNVQIKNRSQTCNCFHHSSFLLRRNPDAIPILKTGSEQ